LASGAMVVIKPFDKVEKCGAFVVNITPPVILVNPDVVIAV
jgi:hypothetical protein